MPTLTCNFSIDLAQLQLHIDVCLPCEGIVLAHGNSGSGKTTFLRCIAGLLPIHRGNIYWDHHCWDNPSQGIFVPPQARRVGIVFHESHLFPHLNVKQNIFYGFDQLDKNQRPLQPDFVIAALELTHLLAKPIHHLSSGESQRVALARALLAHPQLLLLDEALTTLEVPRQQQVLELLADIQTKMELAILYVTHQVESIRHLVKHTLFFENNIKP